MIALFNVLIIFFPTEVVEASKEGVSLWFNNVLPSLLPFIIGANIMSGLGVINFIGVLLSPMLYPAFGVNGTGGFALMTGMTSGYPMGAKITAMLREKNDISQAEAQRLLSFCNNSGPLFILGAVGVGMFHNAKIGYFIMATHYLAALCNGFFFKYYRFQKARRIPPTSRLLQRALRAMKEGRKKDGRAFGLLLGESVKNAMETVIHIGGFIILFSVIVRILRILNITAFVVTLAKPLLHYFRMDEAVFEGVLVGLFEVTNGAKILAAQPVSATQILAVAGIISFGGLSIHAQSIAFLNKTDVKISVYFLSKLSHAIFTMIIGLLLFPLFNFSKDMEVVYAFAIVNGNVVDKLVLSSLWFFIGLGMIAAAIVLHQLLRLKAYRKR